ncbi:MAG: hypothetical protein L6V83_05795 [Christensenella sp.]|nr:MAG: hypothetical protein L6V83_05795 [Christensenella sp.]
MPLPCSTGWAGSSIEFSSASAFACFFALIRFSTMNATKNISTITAFHQVNSPPIALNPQSTEMVAMRMIAFAIKSFLLKDGAINTSENAMISAILQLTEPTALPIAIAACPSAAEMLETRISGRVVATLTIVAPMMKVGIPDTSAIQLAASTNQSPPFTTRRIPSARSRIYPAMLCPSIMPKTD